MSSHHIVRENQEPALIVEDFRALDSEDLGQLLEWSPTVITNAENVDFFLAEGIKVDIVIGRPPSETPQEATKFVTPTYDQTFLDSALSYLVENNFKAVNVLLLEMDQSLVAWSHQINIVLFVQGRRYAFFTNKFEKWKPMGDKLFVDERWIKSFQGMDFKCKGEFEILKDGFVQVEFNTDLPVLVGEEL